MAFNNTIRRLTTADTTHADNFNDPLQKLLENDLDLKGQITVLSTEKAPLTSPNFGGTPTVNGKPLATTEKYLLTGQNGWTQFNGHQPLTVSKVGNMVFLTGFVNVGTKTQDTVMFNIPQQFRPSIINALILGSFNMRVNTNGDIKIYSYTGSTTIDCLNGLCWEV